MKVLIWILTWVVFTFLNELLGATIGIKLGYLLIFLPVSFVAKLLGDAWDDYKYKKGREKFQKNYKEPTPPPGAVVPTTEEPDVHPEETEQPEPPRIKFCRKCGFELLDGSEFCSKCGTPIVKE